MPSIAILTDNLAYFTNQSFPGKELVYTIDFHTDLSKLTNNPEALQQPSDLPGELGNQKKALITAPSIEEFKAKLLEIDTHFNSIIVLLSSSSLTKCFSNALKAENLLRGSVTSVLIDSQTISVGQGMLVMRAAELAKKNNPLTKIEHEIRGLIPNLYSLLCLPSLSYLHHSGHLGYAQAYVGEMLSLLPIYSMEEGHLTSIEKVKNSQGLLDYFQEFADEFSSVEHVSMIQGTPTLLLESHIFREHMVGQFGSNRYSEHPIHLPAALLLGPRSTGLFILEKEETT
jgi:DegV family protein with EDD domain